MLSASVVHYSMKLYQIQTFGSTSVMKCMSLKCYFVRENITRMCLCMPLIVVLGERGREWINKDLPHCDIIKILIQVKFTVGETRLLTVLTEQLLVKGRQEIRVPWQWMWFWRVGRVLSWTLWAGKAPSGRDSAQGLQRAMQVMWKNTSDLRDLAYDGSVTLHTKQASKGV